MSAKLMAQFADNLNQMIDEQGLTTTNAGDAAAAPADDSATPTDATTTDATATPDTGTPTPQIRKIDGPATEPIDLMEIGKGSVLKRVVPVFVALVVVLLLLRRRRG